MLIRRATASDAAEVAEIYLAARAAGLREVAWAHGPDEVRNWVADWLVPNTAVWLADPGDGIAGYAALSPGWVEQLYLRPGRWRRGIGSALMRHAQALHPDGLQLWCFQINHRARAFYLSHGFREQSRTDGDNEEREPDMLFAWTP